MQKSNSGNLKKSNRYNGRVVLITYLCCSIVYIGLNWCVWIIFVVSEWLWLNVSRSQTRWLIKDIIHNDFWFFLEVQIFGLFWLVIIDCHWPALHTVATLKTSSQNMWVVLHKIAFQSGVASYVYKV
jgi:hypothetical protein